MSGAPFAAARAFAPAKVNLFLHVGAVAADGYHPLTSLMVFADVGDRLRLRPGAPGSGLTLEIAGEFAPGLAGDDPGANLVLRAVRALLAHAGVAEPDARLLLDKALPVAAGLGGGSSDAGAALRVARAAFAPGLANDALEALAAQVGADGPACLWARPVVGSGRGDTLRPAPVLPPLHAVLVNPRVACPTGPVYRAYDAAGAPGGADAPDLPSSFDDLDALVQRLASARNDLEAPAAALVPAVAQVLGALRARPQVRLARLSGSGATAFGLCPTGAAAGDAAHALAAEHPGWWVRACRLGGPWENVALD